MDEFLPNNWLEGITKRFLILLFSFKLNRVRPALISILMGYFPAGCSVNQLVHYAQLINSKQFQQWDYGPFENKNRYGSYRPPSYKLNQVKAPVYLIYSKKDMLSAEEDVNRLYNSLGNVQRKILVARGSFTHLDYLYSFDAPKLLYNDVINLARRHDV